MRRELTVREAIHETCTELGAAELPVGPALGSVSILLVIPVPFSAKVPVNPERLVVPRRTALSPQAFNAVTAETGTTAACSKDMFSGFRASLFSFAVAYSAMEPCPDPKTSSPTRHRVLRPAGSETETRQIQPYGHQMPGAPVRSRGLNPYEHFIFLDPWTADLPHCLLPGIVCHERFPLIDLLPPGRALLSKTLYLTLYENAIA